MHRSSFLLTLICFSDNLASFITFGDRYSWECLSNYQSNITCSLNISESLGSESSFWLHFSSPDEDHNCTLKKRKQLLLCELDLSPTVTFTDVDCYKITLHSSYHGDNFSVVLYDDFMPCEHIRPVPPSDLSVLRVKDEVVFQWQSGYDPVNDFAFIPHLRYQLSVFSKHKLYEVAANELKVNVWESRFEPHTNYTVRVRSEPNQKDYKGVWSPWAPALHWRSGNIKSVTEEPPVRSFHIAWYFLPLPLLLVLLSCIPYSRWRNNDFIPSPAPYFRDWNVDVQICSILSSKARDVIQEEESLQIDILTESTDTPPQLTASVYEKMGTSDQDDLTPQSPSMPHSPVGSEVDSGCWIRDSVATERGSITYSEDYCTLSTSHFYAV